MVKVRKDAPPDLLGPLGCDIQTGTGTVLNALTVGPGASFAAFGAGAVGLSGVMAAAAAGATTIFAVDVVQLRLKQRGGKRAVSQRGPRARTIRQKFDEGRAKDREQDQDDQKDAPTQGREWDVGFRHLSLFLVARQPAEPERAGFPLA